MKLNILIRNVVLDLSPRGSGVVMMKLPGGDRAVVLHAGLDVDDAGGAKVRPGEFFFTRPDQFHRFAGSPRQPRRLDRAFAGVLAAVAGAGIRNNHTNS